MNAMLIEEGKPLYESYGGTLKFGVFISGGKFGKA